MPATGASWIMIGNVDGIGDDAEEFEDAGLGDAEGRAVIGRHHHHHGGAGLLRLAAARGADRRGEMGRRHDDGHAAGDMLEHRVHHAVALGVGQHELLGEIGEDAEAVRAGVDHEVDAAALAVEIEIAAGHRRWWARRERRRDRVLWSLEP